MIVTTGKSVILGDGQFQTFISMDDEQGTVTTDNVSYPPGTDAMAALKQRVTTRLAQLTQQTKPPALPPINTVLDLTPVPAVVTPPTPAQQQAQIDRQNFFAADALATQLLSDQAKGYAIDTTALSAAQKQATSLYQPSYRTS